MNKINKKKFIIIAIPVILILLAVLINAIYCENTIETTKYTLTSKKIKTDLSFVLISDLHNKEFGADNKRLISTIKKQAPDFIAVAGDMVVQENQDISIFKNLLTELKDIAPTYFCYGNHELALRDKIDFKSEINSTGALLLDNEYITFKKNNETFLIGGLSDFPYYEFNAPNFDTPEKHFWESFNEKSEHQYTILLHHQPEYIADIAKNSNIDLILCGHTHGGIVRLPFIGGLKAPNQSFPPKYDKGQYSLNHTEMIISSGLGNSYNLPRINNCAEICIIDIKH
ncbi:MAG: metallophosphoesterase [Ruminococcus sp.]|nr:metallophosphoesterase [Ruminococcus sp.]